MSVCLCVRLCVCLFTFEVPFNGLFAPTSQSRMSNIFRESESLGKSNGKKWSNIWTFLFGNGLKSPCKKKAVIWVWGGFQFQWGGCITTWGGYMKMWGGYIGMMRLYWELYRVVELVGGGSVINGATPSSSRRFWVFAFWMIFSVFQKNRVLGYSWSTLLWHRCYYLHRSRDALSPVCGIFLLNVSINWFYSPW